MAYTIVKSDGTVLTTIADGQINTTSTSIGLPGRNYAGYGQTLDTNFVHMVENFASTEPPANPLRGQLWYNTNDQTLYVCPEDGETVANNWFALASTSSGATTFGSVTVTGNLAANNAVITNNLSAANIACDTLSVASSATIEDATIVTLQVGAFETQQITTGSASTAGNITGNWTLTSGSRLQASYADIAERFESDTEYDAGTVVQLGGSKEITAVKYELSDDIFGVISNTAAYLMNAGAGDDVSHPPVAVSGRVLVKVIGKVAKGQRLVSAGKGYARAGSADEVTAFNTIGRSLQDKLTDGEGLVEAIVTIR
jgi:hypothetical protein